jgi:hypothetical protein
MESAMKTFLDAQMKCSPSIVKVRLASRPANRLVTWVTIAIVGVLANIAYTVPSFAQILGTAQLNVERRGHSATLLEDGRVLIVGGDNLNGMVSQAEIFDPVSQTSSVVAASITARTDHTATRLPDGRVLVVGGRDQTGALTSSDIYNPLTATFTAGPSLTTPRSGQTATVLSDGKILIAGGDAGGSAELYNPATQSFSLVTGSMNKARKFHSAILTSSGQVLIVGGVNAQNAVLNTAEVFDPASQSFYLPPTDMQTPRALATLKLLADGKVQIIGGDAELSMEVFDPTNGIFIAKALLPPNADLLGATLSTQSRAALFSPLVLQDPLLQGVMTPEQSALLNRADQSITELPSRNQALVAGGLSSTGDILNSATLVKSSSASVTTDKSDYAPGQIVTITGSGFQPNEQVHIYFHEFPEEYPDIFFSVIANQQGSFVTAEFAPQEIDLGRVFTLTVVGQTSGFTAQTAFKDARNWTLTFAGSGSGSVTITPSTGTINAPVSCGGTGTNATSQTVTGTCSPNITTSVNGATVTFNASAGGGSTFAGWSSHADLSSSTCSGTTNPCSAVLGSSAALTVTFNAAATEATTLTLAAPGPASVPFGSAGPVTLSATLTRTTGGAAVASATVNFTVDAISVGSAVTDSTGVASISTYNPSALLVGDHTVQASFAQQTISSTTYSASTSGNQTLTVTKANQAALTLNTTSPLTYNQSETLSVTGGTTGGTVTYNLLSGPCTILGDQLTANSGTGSCTLTATMAGNTNYNDVTSTPANTVNLQKANQAALTLLGVPATAAYQSMFTVTPGGGSSSNPLVVSTTGVCTASGNDITMTSGTGTCTVKVNRAGDSNYNDATEVSASATATKINQAALTLNTTSPLTYNQSETLSVTGGSTGGAVTYNLLTGSCTISTNQLTANSGTGSCTLTATMLGDSNYNDITSTPANTVNLQKANQAALTLLGVPATAAYQSMFTVTPGGGSSSNPLVVSTTGVCTASGNDITMTSGTGTCTVKVNRAGDSNYNDATEVSASATATKINQTINVTQAAPANAIINTSFIVSATGGFSGNSVIFSSSGACTNVGANFTMSSSVGICTVKFNQAGNANYNPAPEVTQYTNVIFNFTGFFRPVDNLPVLNIAKAGSAVPVKFSLNGNQGLNIFADGYPTSGTIVCNSTDLYDYVEETVTAGGSSLSYDASANQYVYVWKTEKSWAGSCRQLVVKLSDGTYHRANFNFSK